MQDYQRQFIEFALDQQILRFGTFTLKSGRQSPYFFNAGLFYSGSALQQLGAFYAAAIMNSKIEFDVLFGPAYKGITLATTTAIALTQYHKNIAISFNRKEVKDHGEGGQIIGSPLQGKVLIIDDVITAGTAFRESRELILAHHATLSGVIIALDRQERGQTQLSAIQEIKNNFNVPVFSIITVQDLIAYLTEQHHPALPQMLEYWERYGAAIAENS